MVFPIIRCGPAFRYLDSVLSIPATQSDKCPVHGTKSNVEISSNSRNCLDAAVHTPRVDGWSSVSSTFDDIHGLGLGSKWVKVFMFFQLLSRRSPMKCG
jgi:hypothetical protein